MVTQSHAFRSSFVCHADILTAMYAALPQ